MTEWPYPEHVAKWPLAYREAWRDGYLGRPRNKDSRTTIERYDGAYHDGERTAYYEDPAIWGNPTMMPRQSNPQQ